MTSDEAPIGEKIWRCFTTGPLNETHKCPVSRIVGDDKVVGNLRNFPALARLFLLRNELAKMCLANTQKKELDDDAILRKHIISLNRMIFFSTQVAIGVFDRVIEVRCDWQIVVTADTDVLEQELQLFHVKVFE